MLILTRRVGESAITTHPDGTQVEVVILGVKGNQVRVGFKAPKEVSVHREEIQARVDAGLPQPEKGNR